MKEQSVVLSAKRQRFPPASSGQAVWRYCRFTLRYRDEAGWPAERGAPRTSETVRRWCQQCGQTDANGLRRRRPRAGEQWPLAADGLAIPGETRYRWRAGDQDGLAAASSWVSSPGAG